MINWFRVMMNLHITAERIIWQLRKLLNKDPGGLHGQKWTEQIVSPVFLAVRGPRKPRLRDITCNSQFFIYFYATKYILINKNLSLNLIESFVVEKTQSGLAKPGPIAHWVRPCQWTTGLWCGLFNHTHRQTDSVWGVGKVSVIFFSSQQSTALYVVCTLYISFPLYVYLF